MAETKNRVETPSTEQPKTDFNQMVETALADKRLNREERGEILSVIDKMNSEKETINSQTVAKLEAFLKGAQWWTDFEKTKKILLEKISANKQISESWLVSNQESLKKWEEIVQSVSVETPPTNTSTQTSNSTTEKETSMIDKTWELLSSWVNSVKKIFSSETDLSTLPENEREIVEELQKSWFKLKPVEWKTGTYEVDMNWLFDKSILTISGKTMKFSTDTVKFAWKDKEFNFANIGEAKDLLTKINEYINISFELKPLEDIYETHRDFIQQDRHKELSDKKSKLEIDLWLKFDIK